MFTLYTKPNCRNCHIVERYLQKQGQAYTLTPLDDDSIALYEQTNGTRPTQAPILQKGTHVAAGLLDSRALVRQHSTPQEAAI